MKKLIIAAFVAVSSTAAYAESYHCRIDTKQICGPDGCEEQSLLPNEGSQFDDMSYWLCDAKSCGRVNGRVDTSYSGAFKLWTVNGGSVLTKVAYALPNEQRYFPFFELRHAMNAAIISHGRCAKG